MKYLRYTIITLAVAVWEQALAELPEITQLTINPTPPGASVGAAYLKLHNSSDEVLTLTKVSSPLISRIKIHLSEIVDDVATMHEQAFIEIPANESLLFKHGGYHLMLMGLEAPLMPGRIIPLVFHTNQGDISTTTRVSDTFEIPRDDHSSVSHGKMYQGTVNEPDMAHEPEDK